MVDILMIFVVAMSHAFSLYDFPLIYLLCNYATDALYSYFVLDYVQIFYFVFSMLPLLILIGMMWSVELVPFPPVD
jgi:hypothetical protein